MTSLFKLGATAAIILLVSVALYGKYVRNPEIKTVPHDFHSISINTITGEDLDLLQFKGNPILVVNVASRCGYTYQYEGLQKLYNSYKDRGLVIIGIPTNDFLGQEPGTNQDILKFCKATYGVTFPMTEKLTSKGGDQHPIFTYLTSSKSNPNYAGHITWNFNKFLLDANGNVVTRFPSQTKPMDDVIIEAIESVL